VNGIQYGSRFRSVTACSVDGFSARFIGDGSWRTSAWLEGRLE
jgi:hypothetical protein